MEREAESFSRQESLISVSSSAEVTPSSSQTTQDSTESPSVSGLQSPSASTSQHSSQETESANNSQENASQEKTLKANPDIQEDLVNTSTSDDNTSIEVSPGKGVSPSKKRRLEERQREHEKAMEEARNQAKSKREKQEDERRKMQVLVSNFSEGQLNRYEMFRRAAFPKASIKRIMQNITGSAVAQNVVIAMSGISKVFVGEVVEAALDVKEQWNETGPLQPKHLRETVRRMKNKGTMPNTKYKKKLLR